MYGIIRSCPPNLRQLEIGKSRTKTPLNEEEVEQTRRWIGVGSTWSRRGRRIREVGRIFDRPDDACWTTVLVPRRPEKNGSQ